MWIEDKRTAWEAPARHLNGKLFYILYTIIMFFPRCSCRSVQSTVVFGRRRPKLLGSTLATLKGHRARNIPQCWWRLLLMVLLFCTICFAYAENFAPVISCSWSLWRICCCFNCLVEVCRAEGWDGIESGSRALLRQGTCVAKIVG